LLLEKVEDQLDQKEAFQRVGFAAISDVDGSIGDSECIIENWKPPPWSEEEKEHVFIV
jgi:hypothetical protein